MKALLFIGIVSSVLSLGAQESQVISLGPDFRVVETTEQVVNDLGETNSIAHRHTVLETGMNYWTGNEWKISNPVFRIVPGAAVANEVQHRFTVAHNINQEGAIVMETPDGKVFRSTPLILAFRNTLTGESVAIGQIQDSQGEVIAANQVLYSNAMSGVLCSLRYTVKNEGIEQELLIEEPLHIEDFGFESSESAQVRLELWTGFYASPELQRATIIDTGEMEDLALDFGAVQIGQGKTFAVEANAPEAIVAKRFGPIEGDPRLFLVEMVTDRSLRPLMNALEQAKVGKPAEKIKRLAKNKSKNNADLVATYAKTKRNGKKDTAMMNRSQRAL
ncbi:MAG: hypothetical protein HY299_17270, partial [Verrucomicrobia bacterium]|nr:hypothetical protein [Verrucomicrobiota bacterium]